MLLVIKRFVGDTWGRGGEPVRRLILIVPQSPLCCHQVPSTLRPEVGAGVQRTPGQTPAEGRQPDLAEGRGHTRLGDPSRVLGEAGGVAEPADVLAENSEIVLVAHDEVGHGAVGLAVVLIDVEPLLACGQGGARKVRDTDTGRARVRQAQSSARSQENPPFAAALFAVAGKRESPTCPSPDECRSKLCQHPGCGTLLSYEKGWNTDSCYNVPLIPRKHEAA